jgi:hypothetical protein
MKYLAVTALALAGAAAAAAQQSEPPAVPPADLRQALQQFQRATVPAPRQLSPNERAELRRQLSEYGPPHAPEAPPAPPERPQRHR